MNKLLSAILFLTLSGISLNGLADESEEVEEEPEGRVAKFELCHKGRKSIMVGAPAMNAHLGHGDTGGPCEESEGPDRPDRDAAVVMMHCEASDGGAVEVTAFSSSVEFLGFMIEIGDDCANSLAALLNGGFDLKSVTGATEYLLLGEAPDS
jgi:hypothetical protein